MRYVAFVLALAPAFAVADEVHLKSGGRLEGRVRSKGDKIVLETLTGEVTLAAGDVDRIDEQHTSKVEEIHEKQDALKESRDPKSFLEVAAFAKEAKGSRWVAANVDRAAALIREVRDPKLAAAIAESFIVRLGSDLKPVWLAVLSLDGDHEVARRELGFRRHNDRWLSEDEVQAALGNVKFEGKWMSAAERDLILREREAKLAERIRAVEAREKKLEAMEAAIAKARAEVESARRKNDETRAALDKEKKELEDLERKARARAALLESLVDCPTCDGFHPANTTHICPTTWQYCKTCDGYFKAGHTKHIK
jgi:hypothetical protein